MEIDEIFLGRIIVNSFKMKRGEARGQSVRLHPLLKPCSHVGVVLEDRQLYGTYLYQFEE